LGLDELVGFDSVLTFPAEACRKAPGRSAVLGRWAGAVGLLSGVSVDGDWAELSDGWDVGRAKDSMAMAVVDRFRFVSIPILPAVVGVLTGDGLRAAADEPGGISGGFKSDGESSKILLLRLVIARFTGGMASLICDASAIEVFRGGTLLGLRMPSGGANPALEGLAVGDWSFLADEEGGRKSFSPVKR
jgi:hypothetical protein